MSWYEEGVISLTNGSKTVTAVGASWVANVNAASALQLASGGRLLQIESITNDNALQLAKPYTGATVSGVAYEIIPTQGLIPPLTKRVGELLSSVGQMKDAYVGGELAETTDLAQAQSDIAAAAKKGDLADPANGKGADQVANAVKRVANIAALLASPRPSRKTRVVVDGFYADGDGGGGQFYWDAGKTDLNDGGTVFNGWVRVHDGELSIRHFGCVPGKLGPLQMRTAMVAAWEICAAAGIHLLHPAGVYEVAAPSSAGWILLTPNYLLAHADPGFKLVSKSFSLFPGATFLQRVLCAGQESNPRQGVRFTGRIEIDGGGTDVAWYIEHNHCFAFMRCENSYFQEVVSSNAMGDGVYFSGFNGTVSKNSVVDIVRSGTARRKSLVIEQTTGFEIGATYLDNGLASCFDYETFTMAVRPLSARIGSMHCSSPIDLTTTFVEDLVVARDNSSLEIGTLTICPTALSAAISVIDFLGGVNMRIGNLTIDLRKCASTYPGPVIRARNPGILSIAGDLEIFLPDGYAGDAINTQAPGTIIGIPEISAKRIRINGHSVLRINNDCGFIRADEIVFETVLNSSGLKPVQSTTHVSNRATTNVRQTGMEVGTITAINSRARSVIDSYNFLDGKPAVRIGAIRTVDATTDTPLGAVISARAVYGAFASGAGGDLTVINSITSIGQAPAAMFVNEAGGTRVYRESGSLETASTFYMETAATTTPAGIRAKAGSTLRTSSGVMFLKTVDAVGGDTSLGWQKVTTA